MEFIFDECMEEYQATENRIDFIIPAEIYGKEACDIAEKIAETYSEKVEEIAGILADSEEFAQYYPGLQKTEVMLRLGRPTIMLDVDEDGTLGGSVSYFENKIDENEVIQINFAGTLENCQVGY